MGLKPLIQMSHVCPIPGCKYQFRYHYKDPRTHPDTWVMTASSLEHLESGHTARPKLHIVKPIVEEPYIAA